MPISPENLERYGTIHSDVQQQIGFFLTQTFAILPLVCAVESLRAANRLSGHRLYSWTYLSADGETVTSSNGIEFTVGGSIKNASHYPIIFVCGPHEPNLYDHKPTIAWLRKLALNRITLGALDTGSYILAQAGLLDGYRSTIHWENRPGMQEAFPRLDVSNELFEIDRKRWTCAGGTAAMDMMLYLIGEQHGSDLTAKIAELFIRDKIRSSYHPQRMDLRIRTGVSHPKVLECITLMEANIEQPLLPSELAEMIGVSKRQIERLFKRYVNDTPSHYYLAVRLMAAKRLLEQTSMPIIDIAMACGFSSPGHFSHRFRAQYGHSPRQMRMIPAIQQTSQTA